MFIQITKEIPQEVLENVFVTALEGGSNYWYFIPNDSVIKVRLVEPNGPLSMAILKAVFNHNVNVEICDTEDQETVVGTISKDTMKSRLQKLAENDGLSWALTNELNDEGDAESSDIVFQFITLGEHIYC